MKQTFTHGSNLVVINHPPILNFWISLWRHISRDYITSPLINLTPRKKVSEMFFVTFRNSFIFAGRGGGGGWDKKLSHALTCLSGCQSKVNTGVRLSQRNTKTYSKILVLPGVLATIRLVRRLFLYCENTILSILVPEMQNSSRLLKLISVLKITLGTLGIDDEMARRRRPEVKFFSRTFWACIRLSKRRPFPDVQPSSTTKFRSLKRLDGLCLLVYLRLYYWINVYFFVLKLISHVDFSR